MVAFRHRDREHEHFHIIASRVDETGRNTAQTSFNFREVGRFCRAMEERHGLIPGVPMAIEGRKARTYQTPTVQIQPETAEPAQSEKPVQTPQSQKRQGL